MGVGGFSIQWSLLYALFLKKILKLCFLFSEIRGALDMEIPPPPHLPPLWHMPHIPQA